MNVHSIADLMQAITALYPKTYDNPEHAASWTEQYRNILGDLKPDELNAAWARVTRGWTRKTPPLPSEIRIAHNNATAVKMAAQSTDRTMSNDDFRAMLIARADRLHGDIRGLQDEFEANNRRLYAQAEAEGWRSLLEVAVRNAANILAQRNRSRHEGKSVRAFAHGEEWPNIATIGGIEQIAIEHKWIATWRGWRNSPGEFATPDAMNNLADDPLYVS